MDMQWNTLEDVKNTDDKGTLLAIACASWGNCMAGNTPPKYFGEMMVIIGEKVGIVPTPDNVSKAAAEWLAKDSQ